jgi:hypothetical protein
MQTNTINTSSTLDGLKIGGISLSLVLGAALVWSTFMTNRASKKLMKQQSSKLDAEGFLVNQDVLDKAFAEIETEVGIKKKETTASSVKKSADGDDIPAEFQDGVECFNESSPNGEGVVNTGDDDEVPMEFRPGIATYAPPNFQHYVGG